MIISKEKLLLYCFTSRRFLSIIKVCLPFCLTKPYAAQAQDIRREK
jgi:hypothetical protein